jgi:hypothetical protein
MELEFWAALIADCPLTAQKLSPLITNKIRSSLAWSGVAKHRGGLGYTNNFNGSVVRPERYRLEFQCRNV